MRLTLKSQLGNQLAAWLVAVNLDRYSWELLFSQAMAKPNTTDLHLQAMLRLIANKQCGHGEKHRVLMFAIKNF